MKRLGEVHFLNKILVLSLIFSLVLFGAYCLGKKIRNKNSNTMVFTKGSPPVATITEKAPEKEAPPIEWEDVVPEENFDWNVPPLPELPQGHGWKVVNPPYPTNNIFPIIYYKDKDGFKDISLPGTLYYAGSFDCSQSPIDKISGDFFSAGLDTGWKWIVSYKGVELHGLDAGVGGGFATGLVKLNGSIAHYNFFRGNC